MVLNSTQYKIIKLAAVLGIVQGFAWTVLTITAIGFHFGTTYPSLDSVSFSEVLNFGLFYLYILNDSDYIRSSLNFMVDPNVFCVFMFIYLVLNLLWIGLSADLYIAINNNKKVRKAGKNAIFWTYLTIIISIVDFIFVCLLGKDYSECDSTILFCVPIGIVLTIAAKGFVLWIVNVALAFILRSYSVKISKKNSIHSVPNIPRVGTNLQQNFPTTPTGYNNPAYNQMTPMYPTSRQQGLTPTHYQQGNPGYNSQQYQQHY